MGNAGRVVRLLRQEGLRSVAWRAAKWASGRFGSFEPQPLGTVYPEDLRAVDPTAPRRFTAAPVQRPAEGYRIAWLISPPSRMSGGHHNAFRFLHALEQAGDRVTVYLYSATRYPVVGPEAVRALVDGTAAYPEVNAEYRVYDPVNGIPDAFDALIACDWQTAYASYRAATTAHRGYLVQDFEPWFYPHGSDASAAEQTYHFGFHGLTAGPWLAEKLRAEFGMSAEGFDFAVDPHRYSLTNTGRRTAVLAYVRPQTPRRASEYAALALAELHRMRPELTIHLVGGAMPQVPFPHIAHGPLDTPALNAVFNECAAALQISLTNTSLMPLESLAAGVVPVVNDAEWTRCVLDNPFVEFAPSHPARSPNGCAPSWNAPIRRHTRPESRPRWARAPGMTSASSSPPPCIA